MTQTTKHTRLWLAAGLLLSLAVLLTVWSGLSGKVLISDPEGIPEAADAVMACIHDGDWETLETMVSGNPGLMPASGDAGSVENLIWEAYLQSLQWTCAEGFSIQGACVTQSVRVTCLDIPGVVRDIRELLAEPAINDQILYAVRQALETEPPVREHTLILTFLREKGQWQLVPDQALQALLSGFTTH